MQVVCVCKGSAKEDDTTALIKLDSIQIVKHKSRSFLMETVI